MTASDLNAERQTWLIALEHAAGELGVAPTGAPMFGWHDRTVGTRVNTADGEQWLCVVAELSPWVGGAFWTGNQDAREISGVPRPRLLAELEWPDGDCWLRAELMTLVSGLVIANDMVLRGVSGLGRAGGASYGGLWTPWRGIPPSGSA